MGRRVVDNHTQQQQGQRTGYDNQAGAVAHTPGQPKGQQHRHHGEEHCGILRKIRIRRCGNGKGKIGIGRGESAEHIMHQLNKRGAHGREQLSEHQRGDKNHHRRNQNPQGFFVHKAERKQQRGTDAQKGHHGNADGDGKGRGKAQHRAQCAHGSQQGLNRPFCGIFHGCTASPPAPADNKISPGRSCAEDTR